MQKQSDIPYSHLQICNLCEAMCGLKIEMDNGQVTRIKGNPEDTFSKGYMCAKALALKDIHEDKNRLRQPVRRTPKGWKNISWETAFKEIESELSAARGKFGRNSIALYLGNPRYHHHGSLLTSILLKKSLNSKNCFSVASSDHLPHMLAAYHLFGHMAMLPVPDIDRTEYLLCFGANPLVSNGSVMSAPNIRKRLKQIQHRGGKIITIDPRKTDTGKLADRHIFIKPEQDTFLLLGLIQLIFKNQLVNKGEWQKYTKGLLELDRITQTYTVDKVAKQTGIEQEVIESIALEFATAKKASAYGRFGICTQNHGAINGWLIVVLNIITGNLDQAGGFMFPTPAADLALLSFLVNEEGRFNKYQSPVNNFPSFDSEIPVIDMADEMLANHSDAIKVFINIAGNPVLSTPDGKKLGHALGQLDFMVAVDSYINESNQFANIVLPPTSPLERSQYNMTCNLTAVRNNARFSTPLFTPASDAKHDWQIFLHLSNILNREKSFRSLILRLISFIFKKAGPDNILDLLLRLGPYGFTFRKGFSTIPDPVGKKEPRASLLTGYNFLNKFQNKLKLLYKISPFSIRRNEYIKNSGYENKKLSLSLKKLKRNPNGFDLGAMIPVLPDRLFTTNKIINLTPDFYVSGLEKISTGSGENLALEMGEFYLIGRRSPRSMNSWLNNVERLTKGKPSNTLLMNPENALTLDLKADDIVRIESNNNCIFAVVELCPSIMKDVVSLPHGWGNQRQSTKTRTAETNSETSFNDLTSSFGFDPLSGMSRLNGLIVRVTKPDKISK